jgi:hypothetical protein
MSVNVTWKVERRIIYVDFSGTVSIEEIEKASSIVVPYIREGQAPVHVIADMVGVDYYPREFGRLVGAIPNLAEVNLGKTILIGSNNALIQLMVTVIRHAVQIDLRMFDSMEKTLAFLHETDPTLPDGKPV